MSVVAVEEPASNAGMLPSRHGGERGLGIKRYLIEDGTVGSNGVRLGHRRHRESVVVVHGCFSSESKIGKG